jgi:hypothetical protein
MTHVTKTLDSLARNYAKIINGPTNGLGQCVSPIYGRSDQMLINMVKVFGRIETDKAITRAMYSWKEETNGL